MIIEAFLLSSHSFVHSSRCRSAAVAAPSARGAWSRSLGILFIHLSYRLARDGDICGVVVVGVVVWWWRYIQD